jgi:hypothetical protein
MCSLVFETNPVCNHKTINFVGLCPTEKRGVSGGMKKGGYKDKDPAESGGVFVAGFL